MKARREIKEGEDLLAVPESAVIRIIGDTPSFPRNMDQLVSKEVWKQLPWYAQLSLMSRFPSQSLGMPSFRS